MRKISSGRHETAAGFAPEVDFDLGGVSASRANQAFGRGARAKRRVGLPRAGAVFGAAFAALMLAIGVNALTLQKERHPAPWFDTPQAPEPGPAPSAKQSAAEPATPTRPAPQTAAVEPDAAPAPQAPAAKPQAPAAKPKLPERPRDATASLDRRPKDPIGDLLKSGKTAAASPEPSAAVAAIQRTLAKLGYGVTVDGVIGPATQRAIAKFEHDHRLPVKGQLTARLFQEITAAAKH